MSGEAPDRSPSSTILAVACLFGAMVSFQIGASIAKSLFPLVGAEGATLLRQAIGAPLLIFLFRPWRSRPTRNSALPLISYGVALGAMSLLFYMSLRTIPLGIAVALYFSGPLTISAASLRRPPDFLWLGLAGAGLLLLLPLKTSVHSIDPKGAMLALAAGASWAAYILAGRRAGRALGHGAVAYGAIIAALVAAPFGISHAGNALLSPPAIILGLVVALFSNAIPGALEMVALTRLPPKAYGTLVSASPAIAAIMGLIILGEALSLGQWCGIGAIAAASIGTAASLKAPPKR